MPKTILIVDDAKTIVAFLIEVLKKNFPDVHFVEAANGREACKMVVKYKPSIILMDWEMPVMTGFEALVILKKHEQTKKIPIILLSGSGVSDKLGLALEAGATDFLKKPIDEFELVARTRSALTLSDTITQLEDKNQKVLMANYRNETIVRSILPAPIIKQLKTFGSLATKLYKNTVVLFVDIVDFTAISAELSPSILIKELHDLFTGFDSIIEDHHCTRIKTIGDAYMAVCGMFDPPENTASTSVKAALKLRQYVMDRNQKNETQWEIRIGMYSGSIIASAVSRTNMSFDIFGETVNMASRLQNSCDPMQINVCQTIRERVKDEFKIIERTPRTVKGKGVTSMYYIQDALVEGRSEYNSDLVMTDG